MLAVASPLPSQPSTACAPNLATLVPNAQTRRLLLDDGIQRPLAAGEEPQLAPLLVGGTDRLATVRDLDAVYGAELLRLVPIPERRRCDLVGLYNAVRSVSALAGVEYFSQSRNRFRVLYRQSFFVTDLDSRQPTPDPHVAEIPSRDELLLFQDDSTFGGNLYHAEYLFENRIVTLRLHNLTTMWWSIIPLVRPENFRTVIVVTPTDVGLLFYAVAVAQAPNVGFIRERGQMSLSHRLDALERWLRAQLS